MYQYTSCSTYASESIYENTPTSESMYAYSSTSESMFESIETYAYAFQLVQEASLTDPWPSLEIYPSQVIGQYQPIFLEFDDETVPDVNPGFINNYNFSFFDRPCIQQDAIQLYSDDHNLFVGMDMPAQTFSQPYIETFDNDHPFSDVDPEEVTPHTDDAQNCVMCGSGGFCFESNTLLFTRSFDPSPHPDPVDFNYHNNFKIPVHVPRARKRHCLSIKPNYRYTLYAAQKQGQLTEAATPVQ